MNRPNLHIFFLISLLFSISAFAQDEEVKIEFGKKSLLIDESFVVKVIIKNSEKWEISTLPIVQGFSKGSKQVAHSQSNVNGKKVPIHTITQTYSPAKEGILKFPSFTLTINEKEYSSESILITVTAPKPEIEEQPIEEISTEQAKSNAFISVSTDKNKVFIGEGFRITLTFYLAENATAKIDFTDDKNLNQQIETIAKKLKPTDCLEERTLITQIKAVPVSINGVKYAGYKVFDALYFPLNGKTIDFPEVELKMNLTKNDGQIELINYLSKPLTINLLSLPEHPLKNKVIAGDFYLFEQLETRKIKTGKTFSYNFRIVGQGNFSTINLESLTNDSHFDFFQPTMKEVRLSGQLNGEKEFRFRILPKDSVEHNLGNYFYWIFFNTKKQQYDTLKSSIKVRASGKTIEDEKSELGDIYAGIDKIDTSKIETNYQEIVKNIANVLIILMLFSSIFLFDFSRKRKNKQ